MTTTVRRICLTPVEAQEYFELTTSIRRAKEEIAAYIAAVKYDNAFLKSIGVAWYPAELAPSIPGYQPDHLTEGAE